MITRTLTVNLNDPDASAKQQVEFLRQGLIACRGKSEHPEELEWEIRLYDFILEDVPARLRQYLAARDLDDRGRKLPKRQVAKLLGWNVP